MSRTYGIKDERVFTIELRSKGDVRNVSLDGQQKVFIEGSLGTLERARFVDDLVLEVIGSSGELRVDLGAKDLQNLKSTEAPKYGGIE
jgi:hypothetical protein